MFGMQHLLLSLTVSSCANPVRNSTPLSIAPLSVNSKPNCRQKSGEKELLHADLGVEHTSEANAIHGLAVVREAPLKCHIDI